MPETDQEDIDLMLRARAGETDAFVLLVSRHRLRVEGFLYRLLWNRQEAEDAAQDVFLRLWLARCRYEPRSRFTTYLYQIARTTWLERERRASCRPRETEWPDDEAQALPALRAPRTLEPQHQLFTRYRQWQAQRAVAQLSPIQREVFVLVHLEERSLREAAEVLGIPEGTVKSRLHAAVHRLRQCLMAEEEAER